MYPIALLVTSLFIVYTHMQPFNKNRIIMFIANAIVPVIYLLLVIIFNIDSLKDITGIDTSVLTPLNYIVVMVISIVFGSIYLFASNTIDTIKGENENAEN